MDAVADGEVGAEAAPHQRIGRYGIAIVALASAEPVLTQAAESHYIMGGAISFVTLAVAVLLGQAVLGLGLLLTRRTRLDGDVVAVAVAGFAYLFGHFGYWFRVPIQPVAGMAVAFGAWLVAVALVVAGLLRLARYPAFRSFVGWFLALTVLVPVAQLAWYRQRLYGREEVVVHEVGPEITAIPEHRPNVYWIVLDEYGRPDELQEAGIDVSGFTQDLEGEGFSVAEDSLVSYARTGLSLGSTLSMDYVFPPGNDMRNEYAVAAPVVQDDNATFRRFRELGYELAYLPAGVVPWSWCTDAFDHCVPTPGLKPFVTDEAFMRLLQRTPITAPGLINEAMTDVDRLPEHLRAFRAASDGPLFTFAHFMSPHDPFQFDEDCSLRDEYGWSTTMTVDEGKVAYAQEVRCLNERLMGVVREIIADDPDAFIVLQGDHGSRFTVTFADPAAWTEDQLGERFANFSARRLPGCEVDEADAADAENSINLFRVVFACIEGRDPELLPYRAYVAGYDRMVDMTDVTDRVLDATGAPAGT